MTIKEALDTSFDMEKQGYDFYIKASNKAKSAAAKKIFQALAEDENRHIDAIKKYSENLAGDLAMPKIVYCHAGACGYKQKASFWQRP